MAASVQPSVEEDADKHKVNVIFFCRDSSIPERRLVLSPNIPVVRIGRSSKVPTKGFIPAPDNAWFDNPVMSRQHAELLAKFDEKGFIGAYLKDVSSFHGTFHTPNDGLQKERRIPPNEMTKLANGDIIQFGTEIIRSNKTYPPCYVDFLIEEAVTRINSFSHRAFTVPDYIDDEEDGDGEDVDDFTAMPLISANRKSTPAMLKGWTIRSRPSTIDLTVDSDNLHGNGTKSPNSGVIDLTSEPAHESDAELYTASTDACRSIDGCPSSPGPASSLFNSRRTSGKIDSGHFSKDMTLNATSMFIFDERPEWSGESEGGEENEDGDDDQGDDDGDDSDDGENYDSDLESAIYPYYTDEPSEIGEMDGLSLSLDETSDLEDEYRAAADFDEESASGKHTRVSRGPVATNSYIALSDVDADFSLNECDEKSWNSDGYDDKMDDITAGPQNSDTRITPLLAILHGEPDYYTPASIPVAPPPQFTPKVRSSYRLLSLPNNRAPSPSDAALFRCQPFDDRSNSTRARELGMASGKFEYFAAREENRAAVNQHHQTIPISAMRETLVGQTDDDRITVLSHASHGSSPPFSFISERVPITSTEEKAQRSASAMPDAYSFKLVDTDVNQSSAWTNSGDQFIINPPQDVQGLQPQPVELDMTSAFKFQQSKLAAQTKSRRLPIQYLLAQEPKECSPETQSRQELPLEMGRDSPISHAPTPVKRSYDEAFSQPEASEPQTTQTHASGSNVVPGSDETSEKSREHVTSDDLHDRRQVNPVEDCTSSNGLEAFRPTKRVRVAQAIAFVALGGAATFSYLVNSAPVF
ncbi:hypothetical protein GGR50DRAFT_17602 [Xylaria sp. CBS 124048]|nr:hypothetical protein GGR50DRAFT_17602 [Xylaria sp. CBS 124048]